MNIFLLDINPALRAQYHHDVHVPKMVVETMQIISTAIHSHPEWRAPERVTSALYRRTHKNHPCVSWVDSLEKVMWLAEHGIRLATEFWLRKVKVHKTESRLRAVYDYLYNDYSSVLLDEDPFKSYPTVVGPSVHHICHGPIELAVQIYRQYYREQKTMVKTPQKTYKPATWTGRERPSWL